jgi:two-component system, LytTR family, response regulator AlgR
MEPTVRVLIVDDEPAARRRLGMLLEDIDAAGIELVGEAGDGLAALDLARERSPDVILLDIAMREVDGFDVARHLPAPRPLIIFQTAHQQFALEAFEHDALDYVVKPIRKERLAAALERARARLALSAERREIDAATIRKAGAAFGYVPVAPARLLVRHGAGHRLMPLEEIVRFSAADGVVHAHTANGAPLVDYSIGELEARTAGRFVRTSRADLVNVARVDRIVSNGDGSLTLTLSDSTALRVSRRRAADVRRVL